MLKKTGNIQYITFDNLTKAGVVHGFPTILGGVSSDCYSSLNFGKTTGDDPEKVEQNYKILSQSLGFDRSSIISAKQTHTNNVEVVDKNSIGQSFVDVDGFITNDVDITLMTYHADCIPVFIYDKKNKCGAMIHSGWKGTELNITTKAIQCMIKKYNTESQNLIVGIGPSICEKCFEVSEDVYKIFYNLGYKDHITSLNKDKKAYINLRNIVRQQLLTAGVLDENIEITKHCTMCESDLFYSHRRMGIKRGTHGAFMRLERQI